MKKIKKQAILLTLTLILILFACNAVSAADNSNNITQSYNSSKQLSAANPTAAAMNSAPSKVVISGKVLKCSDGTPFSGVTVTASKGGTKLASTTTGSDGTYTLSFLSSDAVFNVTASYPGHVSSSKNVAVASGAGGTSYGAANFKMGLAYVYVSPSGNDGHSGDSSHPVQTIGKALSLVNNGGTIYLASGTYSKDKDIGLTIDRSVTIVGQGQTNTIINAKGASQIIFIFNSGVTVTIKDLTFANGTASNGGIAGAYSGGAIYNEGTITLNDCTFTNNRAVNYGGAISNYGGTIGSITGCTFTSNTAIQTAAPNGVPGLGTGGAIYNTGTCTIDDCTFKNNSVNTAITDGDGAAIYNSGTLTATFSIFEDNTAESGAIWNKGTSTITGCAFTNNHATNIGGAIENYGTMAINLGTFTGNTANSAGAISNYGSLTIINSTFTGNTAAKGGAISQRDDGSSGSNNALTITCSTFNGNTATTKGSAIYCGSNAGTCNIHFNCIYGNTGTNDIYSDSTIDAINNWWGTNFSGTKPVTAGRVNSNVNAGPWIVLTLTSSDNLVDIKGNTTVKANLKYNSAGTDVSSLGTVPDEDVVFTFDSLGSVSPTSGTISKNLNATTTFTAGSTAGKSVVSAAVNGQTVTTTIKIKDLSNVYVNPNTGNDSTGDGSPTAPLQSLAKAISEVRAGGTVHVAKGTYNGANNRGIRIDKDVTIIGESQDNTIIDAQGQNSTFFVGNDFTVTIKNLMFSNGNAISSGNGGAIVSSGTLNLNNCTFINNTAEIHGGAIYTNHPLNISGCTFTNNTAAYSSAIGCSSYDVTYTVTVHFSSFVNNTATKTGNVIYCYNYGSANAENNWWGSNNPDFDSLVNGTVDYSPWMVLNITSNTATIKKGGSAAITVNMLYDSDGNYHNPASGHVPDGADVSFTGTRGSLNPTGSTLIDGHAASIFTANAAGAAVVKATVDDETVQTSITVTKANTHLLIGNAAGVNGKFVNLTATLTDENGNPVNSETVNFNVNGNTHSATTDASGAATWSYPITENAGIYTVNADFAGDDNYILNSGTGTLTVNTKDTTLIVGNVTGVNGKTVNLTATLTDADGPVSGENVNFHVNGKDYTVKTDASGVATWSYPITETAGIYTINASFVDGKIYANSSGTGKLTVNTIKTTLTVNNATGYNGKTANLTATLKDENGNPLSRKTVTFTVNGTDYTATTDASGLAVLSYKLTKAGVYNIIASFSDGAVYANSTGSGNLTVNPAANLYIKITSNNNNPKVGEKFLLTYKLGNYGPDAAENVTITFKLPEGLDFVKVTADTGNCTYDPATRTVTWTINSVPVGDPYLYFTVKAAGDGTYKITPDIVSLTYNSGSNDGITINVKSPSSNTNSIGSGNGSSSTVNAASTISMQKTGIPLNYLILAIFLILSGLVPKRK